MHLRLRMGKRNVAGTGMYSRHRACAPSVSMGLPPLQMLLSSLAGHTRLTRFGLASGTVDCTAELPASRT